MTKDESDPDRNHPAFDARIRLRLKLTISLCSCLVILVSWTLLGCGGKGEDSGNPHASQASNGNLGVRVAPEIGRAERSRLGEIIVDHEFLRIDGSRSKLSEYAQGQALAIFIRDTTCPIGKKQGPSIARIEAELTQQGLRVLFLNPVVSDDVAVMKSEKALFGFQGAYIDGRDRVMARDLVATSSAEVFLLDAERRLLYRGAIDDQYGLGYVNNKPKVRYLIDAVAAYSKGEKVAIPATTAPGCYIDLREEVAATTNDSKTALTYHRDISPIFQKSCQNCHREGENGPYNFVTYKDAIGHKGMIHHMVETRKMPPWFASDDVGGPWRDDLRLAKEDREAILKWIDDGCVEGDPADGPEPLPFVEGWKIGEPDAVVQVSQKIRVPAEGVVQYQYPVVQTDFGEDKWLRKIELRNDHPEVLHHILVFLYTDKYQDTDPRYLGRLALQGYFAILSPGVAPIEYPGDRAKLLPKSSRLLFQIHYNAVGREVFDQPKLGFVFADGPPKHAIECSAASSQDFIIPAGAGNHPVSGEFLLPQKSRLFGWLPHMHEIGKSFAMDLIYPDGRVEPVLRVPEFDFNWQMAYRLQTPVDVPAGTRVRATGWYDNSPSNPAAQPDAPVYFGLQTTNEMMIGYFEWMKL